MRDCAPGPQLEILDVPASAPEARRLLRDHGDNREHICVIARVNGRVAGAAVMRPEPGAVAHMLELVVAPAWRGTGIERHLVEALQQRARDRRWTWRADDDALA